MKPIRTVIVRNCRGITGVTGGETYLLSLLQGFDPEKCKCLLICIVNPKMGETPWLKQLKKTGFEHVLIPVSNPFSIHDTREVIALIKKFNADVVHCLDHRSDLVGLISAKLTGRPVVASFLGWTNFPKGSWRSVVYPWIDRLIINRLDAVITDSVAIGEDLRMRKREHPIVAIRNGIDTQKFDPHGSVTPFSQDKFTKEGHFIIGMVGRIHPVKGHLNFLKSAKQVLEAHPNCRFLIVGSILPSFEYYEQEIKAFITENKMDESVLITHASLDEVPAVMASLDVLAAPSFAESFSFTMLEGMAMERTVVSTDVGGATEMITDGETGFLISADDVVPALTQKITMLIENPKLREDVGKKARKKIVEELSIELMGERTLDVYKELVDFHSKKPKGTDEKLQFLEQLAKISC